MNSQNMNSSDRCPWIKGYLLTEKLYASVKTSVYRGIQLKDTQPVVLKLLRSDRPSMQDLLHLRNHYTITKNLDLAGIVPPLSLESFGNGFVLVMPDDRSTALSEYIALHSLNLAECLAIAIQLAEILHDLHQ